VEASPADCPILPTKCRHDLVKDPRFLLLVELRRRGGKIVGVGRVEHKAQAEAHVALGDGISYPLVVIARCAFSAFLADKSQRLQANRLSGDGSRLEAFEQAGLYKSPRLDWQ